MRILALYCAGNLGLSELSDELLRVLAESPDLEERQAAAIALAEVPRARLVPHLTAALEREHEPMLSSRLVQALLACVRRDDTRHPELVQILLARLAQADPEAGPTILALLGRCGDEAGLPPLLEAARSDVHRQASVALTALGRLGDDRALGTLLDASGHADPERRLRAVEALGHIRGSVAADRLAVVLLDRDEESDIRQEAVRGLERRLGDLPDGALAPPDPTDPLAAPIMVLLRDASAVGAGLGTRELDRRLEDAVPGLSTRE